jgi:hypothetical protein
MRPNLSTKKDLTKMQLYESVKILVDLDQSLIHLPQIKIYTVFSIAFQYLLYHSTKSVGHYIIRVQDPIFAQKLAKFAKDFSTRKFMDKLLDLGKLKYQNSTFFLDSFHVGSWHKTKELQIDDIQGVLIAKHCRVDNDNTILELLPEEFYYSSFVGIVPKLLLIDPEDFYDGFYQVKFPVVADLLRGSESSDP